MKMTITSILSLIITNIAMAQFESYGAKAVGDTLKIWDINITSSCGSKYIASASLPQDSIIVTEQDTSTRHAVCSCFYDVNVGLTGLATGSYQIVIYRQQLTQFQYAKDTLILVASFSFAIAGNAQQPSTKILASDCHDTPTSVYQSSVVSSYTLLVSYPNPFNPTTTIRYSIPQTAIVTLEVFDEIGRSVTKLVNERESAGEHTVLFDASKLGSGVYVCRLVTGEYVLTNKLVLLK